MGRTVEELSASLSSDEFLHWRAYYQVEPFGPAADWIRFARLMSSLTNSDVAGYLPESFEGVDDGD